MTKETITVDRESYCEFGYGFEQEFISQLLNCPFCGGRPKVEKIGNYVTVLRKVKIKCKKCRIEKTLSTVNTKNPWSFLFSNIKDHWNRREK